MSDSVFDPTPWSAVVQAAGDDPERARRAFERLCGDYRDAIAHWMRLQRLSPEDAEDATHDFLKQWLQRDNPLQGFQRGERRFREFLRVCLRRFLVNWHEHRRAARRGGGTEHIAWEHDELIADGAESHTHVDFALATQIHADALHALQAKWRSKGPDGHFDRLRAVALGDTGQAVPPGGTGCPSYDVLAAEFGVAVGTVKSWVFRFRQDYHTAFRDAVSRQADPSEVDQDVMYLHRLLLRPPGG